MDENHSIFPYSAKNYWGLLLILCTGLFLLSPHKVWAQDLETYTHRLSQSTADHQLWTTTPGERVFIDTPIPAATNSLIKVYAAKNEYEPFQVVINPDTSENITVSIGDFGSGITAEIYQVKYINILQATDNLGRTGPYPDPLWPLEKGATVSLTAGENTAFWFSISVPKTFTAGDYTTNVHIANIDIPVMLHVFDFAIPDEIHVKSQMNFSHSTILSKYSVPGTGTEYWMYVNKIKQYLINHRLTPKSALWPGGVTSNGAEPFIDYDCQIALLSDNYGIWGFEDPANKYLDGHGFDDGAGFPSFMAATFRNNDASADQRPDTFCSITRSLGDLCTSDNPNSAYNTKWFQYMVSLQNYLNSFGYLDKAYYYFANEPQDQADYDAVACYSQELKIAAPHLKLMVSEEPKPEIFNHSSYPGAKIDIWLAVLQNYSPSVSLDREKNHGEETWIYFLHGTHPPYFNPITLDHPAIESKLTGWFLWKYRIRGIAYYSLNNWSKNPWADPMTNNHNGDLFMLYPPTETNDTIPYGSNNHRFVPSIRFELMRDSLEDYEYLYVLNGGASLPQVDQPNDADQQVDKIISGLTGYTRNSEFMYNLRKLIGLKNGYEIAVIPDIHPPPEHSRALGPPGNYYINFQDPAGSPTDDPLIMNGKEYMKIGWNVYDEVLGYGWYGDMAHVMYGYLSIGPNELQKSIIYDDWGRQKTFEFVIPNGTYEVTVSVGWEGRDYTHNKVEIEGVGFVDDEVSNPYIVRTKQITVDDYTLTMLAGIFDEYTMLNYLTIEAVAVDTVPPIITIYGWDPLEWPMGKPYTDPGFAALDDTGGDITSLVDIDTGGLDVNTPGIYTITYTVADNAGNGASVQRTIKVVDSLEILITLKAGYNLFSYPFTVPSGLTSETLPAHLGVEGFIQSLGRFDPVTDLFQVTEFSEGPSSGVPFPIITGEGYVITMYNDDQSALSGAPPLDSALDLYQGINLVGFVSSPSNLTSHELLRTLGDESEISGLTSHDATRDNYLNTRYFFGKPAGPDFPIKRGDGYFIYMKAEKLGWKPANN